MATIIIITPPPKNPKSAEAASIEGAKFFDTEGMSMDDVLGAVKDILDGKECG